MRLGSLNLTRWRVKRRLIWVRLSTYMSLGVRRSEVTAAATACGDCVWQLSTAIEYGNCVWQRKRRSSLHL
jgi:hypothetical protein